MIISFQLEQDRNTFIKHNVDLNSKFTQINRTNSLGFSEDLDEDFENNIYYLMLNAFLDGCYAFDKLDIKRERRWWRGQLFKGSPESPVPYIVGLSHFLTVVMPIVNISFRILLNWYNNNKNTPGGFKGVDVEKIRHGIYSDTDSNGISFVEWERLECQTESGTYSKSPFLLRSATLLNDIMPVVCKRQHILFNKFKTNLSRNVNADNTVGQPSRANADPISDPNSNGSLLFSKEDKLRRFAEHYELLASDVTGHRVRQGCPLSPILFNLFINDIFNNCLHNGVKIDTEYYCGGLFADDIVLCAPSRSRMNKLLRSVGKWAKDNEMTFGINKCATLAVRHEKSEFILREDPTFYLTEITIPKTDCYTYLGVHKTLDLKFVINKMKNKVNKALFSIQGFLKNDLIPIPLKRTLFSAKVIGQVSYYAPLLGSNKNNTSSTQTIINKGFYWILGYSKPNSFVSIYCISKELNIPPLSGKCALAQVRCFNKWKDSNCIISKIVNNVATTRK
ncbi:hypothetical protein BCR32DRAFT_278643 [Anaeromyces robustus]|uniref:Reverse transcriptase domain-containing protein n=1 Tax=Anaeromyces robustus TaxID=1754192 RepID=A0A1Y1XAF6_9FUNG|nr:hypothetical protein BCR32DRAFT_278643 [Anaeromyces robustus]|eukprot:ORX82732.1 hypothetical protein BCR32DRAFT_278643 [Anaeromyces robustus]